MDAVGSEERLIHARLTDLILGCGIEIHRHLGPGLLESAYRTCLVDRLRQEGLAVKQEVPVPVSYQGRVIETAYRADLIVGDSVLLELKSTEALLPIHSAQIRTYLKFLNLRVGLLMNFNVTHLMSGVRRYVH